MAKSSTPTERHYLDNVIAVIGCDGSGKSTLSSDLLSHIKEQRPAELIYLGQSSGNIGNWIKNLPIIGKSLNKFLKKKAKKAHGKKDTPPDMATVLVIYLLSKWRVHKFRKMLRLSRRGIAIITDRYPQAEVPGFYFDGTGLGALQTDSWLAKKLSIQEYKLYQWMASHKPALVIRLNIDEETAFSRKPDHKLEMLRKKISVIPELHFNHAQILDLSSLKPYAEVLEEAINGVEKSLIQ